MDHIGERLIRMRSTITRFSGAASVQLDIQVLRAQISLRKIVLKDIQFIRARLRPLLRKRCGRLVLMSKPANRRRQISAKACRTRSARSVPPQMTA